MIIYKYTCAYTSYTNQTNQCSVGYEYVSIKLTTSKINKSHIQPFDKISQVCLLLISCWFNPLSWGMCCSHPSYLSRGLE